MIKHYNIKIYGFVQGVCFRMGIEKMAKELDLFGWVCNEVDGTVCVEVEGSEENLQKLINYCNIGPSSARVEKVKISEGEVGNYDNFKIKY